MGMTSDLAVSDEVLGTFIPVAVYWMYSGVYALLGDAENYRLHTEAEEKAKNAVAKSTVVRGVLLQQALQIAVSLSLFTITNGGSGGGEAVAAAKPRRQPPVPVMAVQFLAAMVVLDTWQYFMHRYLHSNRFLYKHVHSKHHALVVPYAFGALYNHPAEGLLLDTAGGALAFLLTGMTPRTAVFFFSFATVKTVDDHCGLWLPEINLLQRLFRNNSAYHDVHHQLYGSKYNFSQPFFVAWDKLLGTHMPYALEKRKEGGGFEVRPAKKK